MDDFVEYLVIFILVLFGACLLLYFCNSELSARKDIIEKTKEYATYDYCEKIDEMWYCFNEE